MKFFFDANLPPNLAYAIRELSAPEGVEVIHKYERFRPKMTDIDWINALAEEGSWAVVSQDRFTRNPLEKEALKREGFIVFMLKKQWAQQSYWDKAARLVRWWPRIMDQAGLVTGGAAFFVPFKFSGKGKLEPEIL